METLVAPGALSKQEAEELLFQLAGGDPAQFKTCFLELHRARPRETLRACLRHLAAQGVETHLGPTISPWMVQKNYFELLLDPEFLSFESARKAAAAMRALDPQFFQRFHLLTNGTPSQSAQALLSRALLLLEGIEDHAVLFPWLQGLSRYPDRRIQSQAVKALCKVRATAAVIARQLKSEDPRVRANAVEALWYSQSAEATRFFCEALADPHHRVVVNALIGLHYQRNESAFSKLLEYAAGSSDPLRLAAVWAFGHLADRRAIPVLENMLAEEIAPGLRASAVRVLATLEAQPAAS